MKLKDGFTLTIDHAQEADATAILEYLNVVSTETDQLIFEEGTIPFTKTTEAAFIRSMKESPNSVLYTGKVNGRIVAVASIQGYRRKKMQHRGVIGISIRKPYWNQGIGTAMMRALVEYAKDNPLLEILELTVRKDNPHAIKLYRNFDFSITATYERCYKIKNQYYDAYFMTLHLEKNTTQKDKG